MPHPDDFASRHIRFRDLIEAGETFGAAGPDNIPRETGTWDALTRIAVEILDPVIERFGPVEVTYGFAGPALTRKISGRIAPELDQHAGHELNRRGNPICRRLGQAVDFHVPRYDSLRVAQMIVAERAFDRLYLYGADRPIHVSVGPGEARQISLIGRVDGHHRPPRRINAERFLALTPTDV